MSPGSSGPVATAPMTSPCHGPPPTWPTYAPPPARPTPHSLSCASWSGAPDARPAPATSGPSLPDTRRDPLLCRPYRPRAVRPVRVADGGRSLASGPSGAPRRLHRLASASWPRCGWCASTASVLPRLRALCTLRCLLCTTPDAHHTHIQRITHTALSLRMPHHTHCASCTRLVCVRVPAPHATTAARRTTMAHYPSPPGVPIRGPGRVFFQRIPSPPMRGMKQVRSSDRGRCCGKSAGPTEVGGSV